MLTEKVIRGLQPRSTRYLVCDFDCLYIEVLPSGVKSWVYRRQDRKGGKTVKKVLGRYPEMSLYNARLGRDEARDALNKVQMDRGLSKTQPTFMELAEEWLDKKCRPSTTEKNSIRQKSRLDRLVYPVLGGTRVPDVSAPAVLSPLRKIENDGFSDLPHDVMQMIGQILRYGIATGRGDRDVTADLRGALTPSREQHRASITKPEEVGALMRAIDALPRSLVKDSLLFNAYVFARPGEVRKAEWSEFNLEKKEWHIPAEKMKMRRPHIVPLSTQALKIISSLWPLTRAGRYVFPSARTPDRPMSDMALMAVLRRLGYAKGEMTVHGLRSMASTNLNEHGWPVDAIERQLAHVEGNRIRAAYNYAQFMDIRRPMMQWYADYLDALRDGQPLPEKPT